MASLSDVVARLLILIHVNETIICTVNGSTLYLKWLWLQ